MVLEDGRRIRSTDHQQRDSLGRYILRPQWLPVGLPLLQVEPEERQQGGARRLQEQSNPVFRSYSEKICQVR